MSVNFHLEIRDEDFRGFEIRDLDTDRSWTAPDYESAKVLWTEVGADPLGYWTFSAKYDVDGSRDVQLSSFNARELVELLGVDNGELSGELTADDLRGRCLVALALAPAAELPEAIERVQSGPTVIHTHRPATYMHDKLKCLLALADLAEATNRLVCWN